MKAMSAMTEALLSTIAEKSNTIERRAMLGDLQAHEALRHFMSTLSDFDVAGDWCWPLRTMRDVGQKMSKTLLRYFVKNEDGLTDEAMVRACMHGVRLILEESVRRLFLSMDDVSKEAFAALMSVLRDAEAQLLMSETDEGMKAVALFVTLSDVNIQGMLRDIENHTLRMLPSFNEAMRQPYRAELVSLMNLTADQMSGLMRAKLSWSQYAVLYNRVNRGENVSMDDNEERLEGEEREWARGFRRP